MLSGGDGGVSAYACIEPDNNKLLVEIKILKNLFSIAPPGYSTVY